MDSLSIDWEGLLSALPLAVVIAAITLAYWELTSHPLNMENVWPNRFASWAWDPIRKRLPDEGKVARRVTVAFLFSALLFAARGDWSAAVLTGGAVGFGHAFLGLWWHHRLNETIRNDLFDRLAEVCPEALDDISNPRKAVADVESPAGDDGHGGRGVLHGAGTRPADVFDRDGGGGDLHRAGDVGRPPV